MGWLKLDDQYDQHDKVTTVHPLTELLDIRGMLSCARRESDGYIAPGQMTFVGRGITSVRKRAAELVAVGRWHEPGHDCPDCPQPPDGWQVHDYLAYNPARSEREAERAEARERMRKIREAKAAASSGDVRPNVPPNRSRSSGNVRSTPSRPPVPSEQNGRAKRDAEKPNPQPPDYEPSCIRTEICTPGNHKLAWPCALRLDDQAEVG